MPQELNKEIMPEKNVKNLNMSKAVIMLNKSSRRLLSIFKILLNSLDLAGSYLRDCFDVCEDDILPEVQVREVLSIQILNSKVNNSDWQLLWMGNPEEMRPGILVKVAPCHTLSLQGIKYFPVALLQDNVLSAKRVISNGDRHIKKSKRHIKKSKNALWPDMEKRFMQMISNMNRSDDQCMEC